MRRAKVIPGLGLTAILLLPGMGPRAAETSGSIFVSGGTNEVDSEETDVLDQRYQVTLVQPLTLHLGLNLNFLYRDLKTSPDTGLDFERRTAQPGVDLYFQRNRFSSRLSYRERRTRGTSLADQLDATSFLASMTWDPQRGPLARLQYRDETNFSNVAVFGRDVTNRTWDFEVGRDYKDWSAWYEYSQVRVDNALSGLNLKQAQHELRGSYQVKAWEDRMTFFANGQVRRVNNDSRVPSGTLFDRPVPARRGLFAVDTTPEIWRLDPAPALIDGDTATPVEPDIDIGGANTFRNIGVDLGFIRPVSQLEVTVDRLSGPNLIWEVYHSPDNLNWELVPGVTSVWDTTFLRYSIRFPETEDQYFKVVNVSVNTENNVLVTEIRALREVESIGRTTGETTDVRTNLNLLFEPNDRVSGSFSLGYNDEDDVIPGVTIRSIRDLYYTSNLRFVLTPDLDLSMYYGFSDREEDRGPFLSRGDRNMGASLNWDPLPTVDGQLSVNRREETQFGATLRTDNTARLRLATELFPELMLTTELIANDSENDFAGFSQSSWTWRESLISQPTRHWTLSGTYSYSDFESSGSVSLSKRTSLSVRTAWTPVPAINIGITYGQGKDDNRKTSDQRYYLVWSPGRKLTCSLVYNENEAVGFRKISSTSVQVQYRPHQRLRLFVTGSNSEEDLITLPRVETTSFRAGLILTI
jgi:hypothetical protein